MKLMRLCTVRISAASSSEISTALSSVLNSSSIAIDDVQRVGVQVVDQVRFGRHPIDRHPQLLGNDGDNPILDSTHEQPSVFPPATVRLAPLSTRVYRGRL